MMTSDKMQPNSIQEVIEEHISLCEGPGWDPKSLLPSYKLSASLAKNYDDFSRLGSSVSECNALMYESVKRRCESAGEIKDGMSYTNTDWNILTDVAVVRSIRHSQILYEKYELGKTEWKKVVCVKMLEFPRFTEFNIRTNKRQGESSRGAF